MKLPVERRTRIRAAVAVVVLAGGAAAAYALNSDCDAERTFFGSVDVRNVNLGFRAAGRLAEVTVEEGAHVKAGQVLARLDAEPYRRALEESRAARDAAAARLALLEKGHDRFDVAEALAKVNEQKATLANAVRTADRMSSLRDSGAQSQRAVDDAIAQHDEAAARLQAAEQSLAGLKRGYRSEEIDAARAELARAEAAFARASLQLEDTQLTAPEDGTVHARVVDPGSMVTNGATALVLTRTSETWIRAYVPEPLLGRAVPGTEVTLTTDSRPDHSYSALIGSVSPQAEFTPKSVETTDLRTSLVYRVRLRVKDADEALRQGMPVTLQFAAEER